MHRLEIDSIMLQYGQRKILSDVYLRCDTGQVIALLGRNGEGKSSLMKIAFGVTDLEDYSVRINGKPIKPALLHPPGVSYLPQHHFIPSHLSLQKVFDLYKLPFEAIVQDIKELQGLQRNKVDELSGGIKRLIETYIIIKKKGLFVLLDEPFTHIMPLNIEHICRWIIEEKRQRVLSSATIFTNLYCLSATKYICSRMVKHICVAALRIW